MNPSPPRVARALYHHESATIAIVVFMHVVTAVVSFAQPPGGSKPPPAPVKAGRVRFEPAHSRAVSFVGTIRPLNKSLVSSSVEGLVEEYRINEGDYVAEGTILARLRTVDLEIERNRAKADLGLLELEKDELELSEPREIVQEQEEFLQSVEGVTKMTAQCNDSSGNITLEFVVGTDLSEALLKVNSRLQQVPEYPEEADEPVISTSDPRANAIAWFILRPRTGSGEEIRAFQEENPNVAPLLEPAAIALLLPGRQDRLDDHRQGRLCPPDSGPGRFSRRHTKR